MIAVGVKKFTVMTAYEDTRHQNFIDENVFDMSQEVYLQDFEISVQTFDKNTGLDVDLTGAYEFQFWWYELDVSGESAVLSK